MNRIFGRLSLALGLSAVGLLGTALFNYLAQPDTHREKVLPPLAFVRSLDGVHYSKRETSVLMSALQEGDSLYSGDLIRTGDLGELRLQFVNDGITADLEADSQVLKMAWRWTCAKGTRSSKSQAKSETETTFCTPTRATSH